VRCIAMPKSGTRFRPPLYVAVAEVMAWVYQLNEFAANAGDPCCRRLRRP
jgi:flagellar biosynthesis protein FlhB